MKTKYNVGDITFAKSDPSVKLIISEVFKRYYCKNLEGPGGATQIRFEKELFTNEGFLSPQKAAPLTEALEGGTLMNIGRKKTAEVKG